MGQVLEFRQLQFLVMSVCSGLFSSDINLCTFFGLCLLKILLASSDHFYTVTFMSS